MKRSKFSEDQAVRILGEVSAGKSGYVNDDASGMPLLGARYYVPVLGRFLTPDPSATRAGSTSTPTAETRR